MKMIVIRDTIGLSDERPDRHCATGHGHTDKCPWFVPRVERWPLLGEYEKPYCEKYRRDLVPDDTSLLRDRACVRDFGSPGAPGRCERIDDVQVVGKTSAGIHAVPSYNFTEAQRQEHNDFVRRRGGR